MTIIKLLVICLFLTLVACGQKGSKTDNNPTNPEAQKYNDSAVVLTKSSFDSSNYIKAISLLDKAISIDSNYYLAYWNKLDYQMQLKQFDNALLTAKRLTKLRPNMPDFYVRTGILLEITGDVNSATNYYRNALTLYDSILDTMNKSTRRYNLFLIDKSVDLILLGQEQKGNEILRHVYNKQRGKIDKEITASLINKSKKELLETFTKLEL